MKNIGSGLKQLKSQRWTLALACLIAFGQPTTSMAGQEGLCLDANMTALGAGNDLVPTGCRPSACSRRSRTSQQPGQQQDLLFIFCRRYVKTIHSLIIHIRELLPLAVSTASSADP